MPCAVLLVLGSDGYREKLVENLQKYKISPSKKHLKYLIDIMIQKKKK